MAKIAESTLQERLERICLLLQRHENGLTQREISENLGFNNRATYNYLINLDLEGKVFKQGTLWFLASSQPILLRKPELTAEQAVILYLAARLFVKQSDRRNETAEIVLEKLANILSDDIHLGDDLRDAARELAQRPKAPSYEDHFRTIVRGYIYRRKVKIVYHPYQSKPFEAIFSPYLLEPSAIGYATYAIGHSSAPNKLRTYKIERIQRAELTRESYTVPSDFPGLSLLRNAWSIFYGEEVTRVILRFHPDVSRRIQETNWHPSQQMVWDETLPGYLQLAFDVADTTDLKPWIRTWGANCEVLEPVELREEMMGEARRLADLYGWYTTRNSDVNDDDPLGLNDTLNNFFG